MPKFTIFTVPKSRNMEVITAARLHVQNGTNYTVQCPELCGQTFETPRQKEKFRSAKVAEMLGSLMKDTPEEKKGDLIFDTVILPQEITELPDNCKPMPPEKPRPVEDQPVRFDLENVEPFKYRKPKFMQPCPTK